jgi:predicted O-methyltransferase YrrM
MVFSEMRSSAVSIRRRVCSPTTGLACLILSLFIYVMRDFSSTDTISSTIRGRDRASKRSAKTISRESETDDLCDAKRFFKHYDAEVEKLDKQLEDHNGQIEAHSGLFDVQHESYHKLFCKDVQAIAEIGFNAGHSAMLMLMSNPTVAVQSFDNARHPYSKQAFEYVKGKFPDRNLEIEWGDSSKTVPLVHARNPSRKFDILIVDGGHEFDVAIADIINLRLLSRPDTLLIVDDSPCRAWCC